MIAMGLFERIGRIAVLFGARIGYLHSFGGEYREMHENVLFV